MMCPDVNVKKIDHVAQPHSIQQVTQGAAAQASADEIRLPTRPVDAARVEKRGERESSYEKADEKPLPGEHAKGDPGVLHIREIKKARYQR